MATPTTALRPLLRNLHTTIKPLRQPHQKRTFFPVDFLASQLASAGTRQTLTATRILPYASAPIYSIISDVASYSQFLPYCQSSTVTKWSQPDSTYARRWPSEGKLVVGYGGMTEAFTSRVYCVPGRIVESVGGSTATGLDARDITHHVESGDGGKMNDGLRGLLTHLRNRWTVEEVGKDRTRVSLELEYAFANPLYATLSAGVAAKVADLMANAYEERVRALLDADPEMARAGLGDIEGSRLKR